MIAAALFTLTLASCGLIPSQAMSSIEAVNVDENRLAIKGYDPVAYFVDAKAVEGSATYKTEYQGAIYHFASAKNLDMFKDSPAKYAPQYGGYCAFGVTQDKKYDVDPQAWAIVDGKLYLNLNARAQRVWDKDRNGNINIADANWVNIANTPVSEL